MTFIKKHPYITGSVAFMTLLILIAYFIYWAFFSIARLEPGELIAEETSPNGEYTVKTYLNNGGAIVDFAVLGILEFENSSKGSKNIYWQYETTEGNIEWQDEDTVKINNIELDVPGEKYDYRR